MGGTGGDGMTRWRDSVTAATARPELDRALTAELKRLQRDARQPSLSAAVSRQGQLLWAGAVGCRLRPDGKTRGPVHPPGLRTMYRVGSVTKPMVALAVLRLAQDGMLDLDEPVARRLPDWWIGSASAAQLLSHTSGLRAEPEGVWWERAGGPTWDELCRQWPTRVVPPGGPVRYSNVGYAVLGRLLEVLTGTSWVEAVQTVVWEPLSMFDTGVQPGVDAAEPMAVHPFADVTHHEPVPEYHAMGPAGQAWSTPTDLLRLAACLSGHGDEALLLDTPWRRRLTTPVSVWDTPGAPWSVAQGCGTTLWNDGGRRWLGHTGSVPGFTADLRVDMDSGDAAAVCGNATHPHYGARPLLEVVAKVAPPEREVYTPEPAHLSQALADLSGAWYWGPIPMTVTVGTSRTGAPTLSLCQTSDPGTVTVFEQDGREWVGVTGGYWYGERLRAGGSEPDAPDQEPTYLDVGSFRLTRRPYPRDVEIPGGNDPGGWR